VMSMSVCLSSHISGTTLLNFREFSVQVACNHGSVLWQCYNTLCTFGFVDDIMFSYNCFSWRRPAAAKELHSHLWQAEYNAAST